jgi:hypothetical protein
MENSTDDLLVRRKRVNPDGEWEYECRECELWLPKNKFRGCVNYIDAYGNCLMCSSCRSKLSHQKALDNEKEGMKELLTKIGFYKYENAEAWFEAKKKQYGKKNI